MKLYKIIYHELNSCIYLNVYTLLHIRRYIVTIYTVTPRLLLQIVSYIAFSLL